MRQVVESSVGNDWISRCFAAGDGSLSSLCQLDLIRGVYLQLGQYKRNFTRLQVTKDDKSLFVGSTTGDIAQVCHSCPCLRNFAQVRLSKTPGPASSSGSRHGTSCVMKSMFRVRLRSVWGCMRYEAGCWCADQHAEHASGQKGAKATGGSLQRGCAVL